MRLKEYLHFILNNVNSIQGNRSVKCHAGSIFVSAGMQKRFLRNDFFGQTPKVFS